MQRVGVVVGGDERLQGGADVVEGDLLGVQLTARGLAVVLELLRALVGAVLVLHRHRPDAAGHPADHRVLGVHAVAEEERQVGREVVDVHAARQVGLDEGEAVASVKASWLIGLAPASAMW